MYIIFESNIAVRLKFYLFFQINQIKSRVLTFENKSATSTLNKSEMKEMATATGLINI